MDPSDMPLKGTGCHWEPRFMAVTGAYDMLEKGGDRILPAGTLTTWMIIWGGLENPPMDEYIWRIERYCKTVEVKIHL